MAEENNFTMTASIYQISLPGKIMFGEGCFSSLPKLCSPFQRILFLHGAMSNRGEILNQWRNLFANQYISEAVISNEPEVSLLDQILSQNRHCSIDAVVAIGGGSVMDAGKALAAALPTEFSIRELFYNKCQLSSPGLPLFAIPTTAGTGAEITKNAVLTDKCGNIKQSLRQSAMKSAFCALIDPELTWSCPKNITADSGMDALTQAIEAYLSINSTPYSDALALEAAKKLFSALKALLVNLNDHTARRNAAEGTMLGAMAFAQCGLGAVHGFAHPIGCCKKIPHGKCCAILLPEVLEWNRPAILDKLLILQQHLDCPDDLIPRIRELNRAWDIPESFRNWALKDTDLDYIIQNCRSGSMRCTPRPFTDAEARKFLEKLR